MSHPGELRTHLSHARPATKEIVISELSVISSASDTKLLGLIPCSYYLSGAKSALSTIITGPALERHVIRHVLVGRLVSERIRNLTFPVSSHEWSAGKMTIDILFFFITFTSEEIVGFTKHLWNEPTREIGKRQEKYLLLKSYTDVDEESASKSLPITLR